jgi:hypothetical protein
MRFGGWRELLLRTVGQAVGTRSEAEVERLAALGPLQRLLFWAIAASYDPDVIEGFSGVLGFRLIRPLNGEPPLQWTIVVSGDRAVARPGPAIDPVAWTQMRLVDFVEVALGRADPAEPMLSGRATLHGDLEVASALAEMFRAVPLHR